MVIILPNGLFRSRPISKKSPTPHGVITDGDIFVPNWAAVESCVDYQDKIGRIKKRRDSGRPCRMQFTWDTDHKIDIIVSETTGCGCTLWWIDWEEQTDLLIHGVGHRVENWFVTIGILNSNLLIKESVFLGDMVRPTKIIPKNRGW
jgi:hypothetical protein